MCLSLLVGVRSCENNSDSLFYIEDIPGVSIGNAADIADLTGVELLKKSVKNAAKQIVSDLTAELTGTFRLNYSTPAIEIGSYTTGSKTFTQPTGINFKQLSDCCRFADFYISSVEFISKDAGTYEVEINGEVFEIEAVANKKTIIGINKLYTERELSIELKLQGGGSFELQTIYPNCGLGWMSYNAINGGNLKVTMYMKCDIKQILCQYPELFGHAMWLLSGKYFYEELQTTERVNYYTVYKSLETAEKQMHILRSRYEKEIKNISKKIIPLIRNQDSCCVICDGSGFKYQHP